MTQQDSAHMLTRVKRLTQLKFKHMFLKHAQFTDKEISSEVKRQAQAQKINYD